MSVKVAPLAGEPFCSAYAKVQFLSMFRPLVLGPCYLSPELLCRDCISLSVYMVLHLTSLPVSPVSPGPMGGMGMNMGMEGQWHYM